VPVLVPLVIQKTGTTGEFGSRLGACADEVECVVPAVCRLEAASKAARLSSTMTTDVSECSSLRRSTVDHVELDAECLEMPLGGAPHHHASDDGCCR